MDPQQIRPEEPQPVIPPVTPEPQALPPDPAVPISYQPQTVSPVTPVVDPLAVTPNPVPEVAVNQPYTGQSPSPPTVVAGASESQPTFVMPLNDGQSSTPTAVVQDVKPETFVATKKSKKLPIIVALIIIILAGLGGIGYWLMSQNSNPTHVFDKALVNALSTKQVEQITSGSGGYQDLKFEVSNIRDPILSQTTKLNVFGINVTFDGYGTTQNTFIKYDSVSNGGVTVTKAPILNKWLQLKASGSLISGVDSGTAQSVDPYSEFFGQYIFGNFSATQRQELVNYAEANNIYQFNAKKVTKSTLSGQSVFVYPVKLDISKLTDYNKKVAAMVGLTSDETQTVLSGFSSGPTSATLYINIKTDELVKVTAVVSGTSEILYKNFNNLQLPAQPVQQMSYAEYQQQAAALYGVQ